ncbi:MAG: heme biosynthesis HemY N-terminal domain-containing protein [Paracoccus sp. (in: a-proteobacteria)]|uniref:heme biosynthesis HemY N-terminal domain-containing protein n=1 Tax=Paracoccus sp. TaxID=267 RepID=UPI0026DEFAF8|nr:heme biosynthesis HemY N-terminal domain-containing protein [Paracoccus sp. (in: a-proteobacteria)]MDO5621205.1 heme biosynthesis HemY N-terminal domain-containing protein [Paracoccus sp. (in: a-proteobacteria)]
MLLSLLKILFFFAVVLGVALGAMKAAQYGHPLQLTYDGTEYTLGPIQALVALAVLLVLGWLLLRLVGLGVAILRFVAGDETALNRYFHRRRERKGYEALSEGMLAIASGEGKLAQDKASKAAKYLSKPHITDLLAAQAAEVAGDQKTAERVYRRLLGDDRTRFVGIRGLMRQELAKGDTHKALLLAQKAYALKPRHGELQDTLLQLQTAEGDWKGARAVLKDKRRQGEMPKDVHIRRDAVLALKEASEVLDQGDNISAQEAAISAAAASPDLIPAAALAARAYIAKGDAKHAARVLEKTWSVRPHPDLAAAYAQIVPDETPTARLRRFDALIRKNPDHEESHLLHAELLLAAEDFPAARRALGNLAEVHPTTRTLSIMAAVERGEGADDAVVRGWLARALTASRGPQWCCDKCHNVMAEWAPVCDSCGAFDTLTWREPDDKRTAATSPAASAAMLPLLVGGREAAVVAAADDADVTGPSVTAVQPEPEVAPAPSKPTPEKPVLEAASAPGHVAPEPVPTPVPASKHHRERPFDVAHVAPGMVPRESDYTGAPSRTVTDPEPVSRKQASAPVLTAEAAPVEIDDAQPIRPDVEPLAHHGKNDD